MTTPATRFYFALAIIAWLGACVYGVGSGGDPIGVATLGWSGGVGDHLGYSILIGLAATSFAIGAVTTVLIDLLPKAAGGEQVAPEAPANPAPWPVLGAFGLGLTAIGAVSSEVLFIAGAVVLGVTLLEWTVQSWADQATGDPEVNASIRSRIMAPLEVPVIGVLVVGFVAVGLSRILLSTNKDASSAIAIGIGVVVLACAVLVATRKVNANATTGLLLAGAVVVLASGVAGVSVGERDFEHHDEGHSEESDEHSEESDDSHGSEEGGFEVDDPGDGVAPTDDEVDGADVGRTEPAEGNTAAENTTTTAEEGE